MLKTSEVTRTTITMIAILSPDSLRKQPSTCWPRARSFGDVSRKPLKYVIDPFPKPTALFPTPIMSRKRKNAQSTPAAADLPPPRETQSLRPVEKPLSSTRLSQLIYLIAFLSLLLVTFYSWRIVQYKIATGGWWNLVLGQDPSRDGK
jgi:hypothetical protein